MVEILSNSLKFWNVFVASLPRPVMYLYYFVLGSYLFHAFHGLVSRFSAIQTKGGD